MVINDIEHKLVVPKWDNSGRKIKSEEISEIAKEMSNQFGGVTINPSVLGCWNDRKRDMLVCEENMVFSSVRDSETTPNFEEQKIKDLKFMEDMAKKLGKEFGQESIMSSENKVEVKFIEGKFKEELPEEKTGVNWFDKLV